MTLPGKTISVKTLETRLAPLTRSETLPRNWTAIKPLSTSAVLNPFHVVGETGYLGDVAQLSSLDLGKIGDLANNMAARFADAANVPSLRAQGSNPAPFLPGFMNYVAGEMANHASAAIYASGSSTNSGIVPADKVANKLEMSETDNANGGDEGGLITVGGKQYTFTNLVTLGRGQSLLESSRKSRLADTNLFDVVKAGAVGMFVLAVIGAATNLSLAFALTITGAVTALAGLAAAKSRRIRLESRPLVGMEMAEIPNYNLVKHIDTIFRQHGPDLNPVQLIALWFNVVMEAAIRIAKGEAKFEDLQFERMLKLGRLTIEGQEYDLPSMMPLRPFRELVERYPKANAVLTAIERHRDQD